MKNYAALFIGGLGGLMLLKFLMSLLFPLIGVMIGVIATAFKILIFALVAYFIYSLIKNRRREESV